jgi:hypothetical protein
LIDLDMPFFTPSVEIAAEVGATQISKIAGGFNRDTALEAAIAIS